ncbi:beta-N-acetylhexosaminidase [Jeongeupia naejangsanensis]|uniref:Beta-N-acetylhexosaminidase n=1 Tax=Jeongeupia naejangsanensis TaxID=613195 RepID=A0ABS2BMM4_9NEIS|nr:beta-N-acetylhexosaminidase [Jeongeupia naejangsanensis]MBM3116857.1 beta-N-acetylhexosaminidase [Jeongeupia naejangsanensis]
MTLQEQIGQLLMAGFDGLAPSPGIERLIRELRIGGVILFRRNVDNPAQVAALCRRLQEINAEVSDAPLLIGIDQEGGMVMRIEDGMTPLPSALAYQAAGSVDDCRELARIGNAELAALGININFAPVLDVNNNRANPVIGVRAFGEDVETVCRYGLAALEGIHAVGLAATAKHFPGHGDTDTDSHLGVPRVGHARARLDEVELAPFRAAIAAGIDAVMSSHVAFPAVEPDPDLPSTRSRAVMTGLLRDELGFKGVVFTDCLEMDAIAKGPGGTVGGAVDAFRAGADVVLISHREDRQRGFLAALTAAVEAGEVDPVQVEASVARILTLKRRLPDWRALPADPAPKLRTGAALALAERVQAQAVRRQGRGIDPARPVLLLTFVVRTRTEIDEVAMGKAVLVRDTLATPLLAAGVRVEEIALPLSPDAGEIAAVLARAAVAEQIVCVSYNAVLQPAQRAAIGALPAERLWLVAGRLPYDTDLVPNAAGRLAAFGNRPAMLAAIAGALLR